MWFPQHHLLILSQILKPRLSYIKFLYVYGLHSELFILIRLLWYLFFITMAYGWVKYLESFLEFFV